MKVTDGFTRVTSFTKVNKVMHVVLRVIFNPIVQAAACSGMAWYGIVDHYMPGAAFFLFLGIVNTYHCLDLEDELSL